jgi:Na+/serine symporter
MNIAQVVQFVAGLAWLGVIGLVFVTVARASRGKAVGGFSTVTIIVVVLALALIWFSSSQMRWAWW